MGVVGMSWISSGCTSGRSRCFALNIVQMCKLVQIKSMLAWILLITTDQTLDRNGSKSSIDSYVTIITFIGQLHVHGSGWVKDIEKPNH